MIFGDFIRTGVPYGDNNERRVLRAEARWAETCEGLERPFAFSLMAYHRVVEIVNSL
ncbi:MAG TPA: hypothetical protein VK249_23940 [Anaerolineales bacterium]|nr:hypothetical protein [Anaerolineales bacterium]